MIISRAGNTTSGFDIANYSNKEVQMKSLGQNYAD